MNQKYLQGLSSNMESPNDAVFFEATPENITAFLMQHPWSELYLYYNNKVLYFRLRLFVD